MNYGLYTSASGVFASMHRMDVASNNLANSETTGFKADVTATLARDAARIEDGVWDLPSNKLLEKLGAGVLVAPTAVNFAQGVLETTGNDLDLALQGEGFFSVRGPDGSPRLTRDGRLTVNKQGVLVQASTGLPVLDENRQSIRMARELAAEKVVVDAQGTVKQGESTVGRVAVLNHARPSALRKEGQNLWKLPEGEGQSQLTAARADVVQGAKERSGTDAVSAMLELSEASRSVESNAKMIMIYDEVMARTVGTFGRMA